MLLQKFSQEAKPVGEIEVHDSVFALAANRHVLYMAVKRELANSRAGTANAKTRAEVSGGGRKPWKQKGTGRARAGSIRSPLWRGGGVIFGPKPRDFSINLPKKVRALAIRSALSQATEKMKVVESFGFLGAPKTKEIVSLLKAFSVYGKKVLILADYKADENQHLMLSARNIAGVKVSLPLNLSVKDLLDADVIIVTEAALQQINERYAA
jgi:large subunit ribosomal protein L4